MFEGLFQPMHLLVIFGIALLVFGPKKLPELGKGVGEGIRGFKAAMNPRGGREAFQYGQQPGRQWLRKCAIEKHGPRHPDGWRKNYSVWIKSSIFQPLPTGFPPV